jgi:hypothetical protein
MNRMLIVAMIVLSVLLATPASATDYYVDDDGSDSNDGLGPGSPKLTLAAALSIMSDGDTLYMMDGTWTGELLNLNYYNLDNVDILLHSGTATITNSVAKAIDIEYCDDITIDGITVTGSGTYGVYGGGGDNITIINSTFTNNDGDAIHFHYNANNLMVDNVTITEAVGHGVHFFNQGGTPGNMDNVTVQNSDISDCGHNMVDIHSYVSNATVYNNDLYFNLDYEVGGNAVTAIMVHNGNTDDTTITYNTIYNCPEAIEIWSAKRLTMEYNTITNSTAVESKRAILLSVEDYAEEEADLGIRDSSISHNVIDDADTAIAMWKGDELSLIVKNVTFENNSFANITDSYDWFLQNINFEDTYWIDNMPDASNQSMRIPAGYSATFVTSEYRDTDRREIVNNIGESTQYVAGWSWIDLADTWTGLDNIEISTSGAANPFEPPTTFFVDYRETIDTSGDRTRHGTPSGEDVEVATFMVWVF